MAKKFTSFIMACMLAFGTLGMFACGAIGGSSNGDKFTVMYYPGGYGSDWLEEFVREFIAEEKYDGDETKVSTSDYKLDPESDVSTYINSKSRCPDLIIQEGIVTKYIQDGWVVDLTDVYNTEVDTSSGKQTIGDYVMPESKMMFTMSSRLIDKNYTGIWAMPMTAKPLSIAYNEKLLKKIEHTTDGNVGDCVENGFWAKAPTTFEEMMTCFADINAQKTVDGKTVSAFGATFIDSGTIWFESLIYTWWAQYQGLDDAKTGDYGSFYDFFNWDSAEKYKQEGIVKSLENVKEIIYGGNRDDKEGFDNLYLNPNSVGLKQYQAAFAQGEIVFCLTGDFFAKENKTFLDSHKADVDAKLMAIPAYDSEHNENYTFLNTTSCMYIPTRAKHQTLAKKFLAFINDERHLVRFTELTGGIRPFGTNTPADKTAIKAQYLAAKDWGNFEKSVFDLYFDCEDVILAFPRTAAKWGEDKTSIIYTARGMRQLPINTDYMTIFGKMKTMSVNDIVLTSNESLYNKAVEFYDKEANANRLAPYMNTELYS
nr:hypothetical protein [Clostridia bacterium]